MIHAYVSIWRCLMHDIVIEIRETTCVHVHHLEISTHRVEMETNCQSLYREYMKGEEGVGGGGVSAPRSQRNEKKSK